MKLTYNNIWMRSPTQFVWKTTERVPQRAEGKTDSDLEKAKELKSIILKRVDFNKDLMSEDGLITKIRLILKDAPSLDTAVSNTGGSHLIVRDEKGERKGRLSPGTNVTIKSKDKIIPMKVSDSDIVVPFVQIEYKGKTRYVAAPYLAIFNLSHPEAVMTPPFPPDADSPEATAIDKAAPAPSNASEILELKRTLAIVYYDKGQFKEAIPLLKEVLKESPEDLKVLQNLAESYYFAKNSAESFKIFKEQIYPKKKNDIIINYWLGKQYFENKDLENAKKHFSFIVNNLDLNGIRFRSGAIRIDNPELASFIDYSRLHLAKVYFSEKNYKAAYDLSREIKKTSSFFTEARRLAWQSKQWGGGAF